MKQWKQFGQRVKQDISHGARPIKNRMKKVPNPFLRWLPRPLPKLRLTHQLLGFFVLVVLLPLLLLNVSIYGINEKAVRKQVARFTEDTAEATYEALRMETGWQQEQARLASQYWVSMLALSDPIQRGQQVKRFFEVYNDFYAVALYNAQGRETARFLSPRNPYSQIPLPEQLADIPKTIHLELQYHPQQKKQENLAYTLTIVVPQHYFGPMQDTQAMVFFKRFPYMGRLVKKQFDTFDQGFAIVDRDGVIIAGPPALVSQTLPDADLKTFKNLKDDSTRFVSSQKLYYSIFSPGEDDQEEEAKLEKVFIKIPNIGWGIITESPYSVQRKYILQARAQSVGLSILCVVVIVVLGLLYTQGINRNFRQLLKGIKALGEGHYSRKIRLITKSWTPYEIIYLTAEFNRMANKISSAWTSIQKLNQEMMYKNQQDLFIAQATQRLHSMLDLDTVCDTAVKLMTERAGVPGALLYMLVEPNTYELVARSTQRLILPVSETDLESLNTLVLNQALQNNKPIHLTRNCLPWLPQDMLATLQPIYYQETPLAVLVMIKPQKATAEGPTLDDGMVLDLISGQIGVAIHQAVQWKQLQKANAQLSKLDELKSNLIDTVSHELRTPLTNIKGYTSRLIRNDKALDAETKIKSLKIIKQQADRLSRLVDDLLVIPDLEREEGIRVFPDRVGLADLVQRTVNLVEEKANRTIRIVQLPEDLDILVDPDRMEQVLLNLLDNAIKYSPENTDIEVTAMPVSDTTAQIQVFNQCEPIPPDELHTLFDKFKRLDERLTRTTRGTGLGLFITKGLVEVMGGRIWLNGDEGFRVLLEVPRFPCQPAPTAKAQTAAGSFTA